MLSKILTLFLVLFVFGVVEGGVKTLTPEEFEKYKKENPEWLGKKPGRMTPEEFEKYKKQRPEVDWGKAKVDTVVKSKPFSPKPKSDSSLLIYNLDGERIIGQRGVKTPPKLATGSMEFFGGVATVTLSSKRDRRKSSLIASSSDDLHILGIYGVTVDSTVISRTFDTIKVYSSGASDTTVAQIMLMVQ